MKKLIGVMLSKNFMFFLMGLSLGFCVNSLFSLFMQKSCLPQHKTRIFDSQSAHQHHRNLSKIDHQGPTEKYTIRYKSKEELENINATLKIDMKLKRPKFLSSELDIKDTLLCAVLTSAETYRTSAVAISKTFQTENSKLIFFMNFDASSISVDGLSFVLFTHSTKHLLPILSLKHLAEKHIERFHWFFIFSDSTYINKEALDKLVDGIWVGDVVVRRFSNDNHLLGDLGRGVLISQAAMKQISSHLDWCVEVVKATNSDVENIDVCLRHSFNGSYPSLKKRETRLNKDDEGSDDISYSNLTRFDNVYNLHRKLTKKKIEKCGMNLKKIGNKINKMPKLTQTLAWPYGSGSPTLPTNRFDLVRWQYFTNDTIYHDQFEDNYMPFTASGQEDVLNILEKIILKLKEDTQTDIRLKKVLNGYRKLDGARGVDYIMDLELQEGQKEESIVRRVHYFKQLSNVRMVKTPFVTENSLLTLLLITSSQNKNLLLSFIKMFVDKCLKKGDNSELFIVITYKSSLQNLESFHTALKTTIAFYEKKIKKVGIMKYMFFKDTVNDQKTTLKTIDEISKTLLTSTLMSLCSLGMELKIDYLNHIRMNTIQGFQVYFPIGFWTYKQNSPSDPSSVILLNQKSGSYQDGIFQHCSFHLSDYLNAARSFVTSKKDSGTLLEIFSQYGLIKVLKGVDSALRISTEKFHCFENDFSCFSKRKKALTNKSRMTNEIFKLDNIEN